ncbi:MAG TPA: FGGY family carbohydrate kinase [Clostridia bacterium]|nr:FGGY family carbohydrate kinase [Clostridia bacterium]
MIPDKETLLLGIDIGTTGAKCAVYNLKCEIVAHAYQEYAMIHPEANWAEQDPHLWWNAVSNNLQDCFTRQKINSAQIASVGVSCTNAIVLVDKDGNPVYNAIGLHDQRADAQVEWLREHVGEDYILKTTANRLAKGSFSLPSLRWLIDNRPELVKAAHKFLMPSGFIIQKLTGVFAINRPRMNLTLLSDVRTGEWCKETVTKAQIPQRLLPASYDVCDIVGTVSASAAAATGLRAGTPVTAGCMDTVIATAASGAVNVGDMAITIGSSGRICYISEKPVYDTRILTCHSAFNNSYTLVQTTDNAGISLRWFRDVFGAAIVQDAQKAGVSVYQYMDQLAQNASAGAGGLLYLPYLSGEKSPIWNTKARGVFFGAGLNTEYRDFVRAVMEGVAFSIRDCMSILIENATSPDVIPLGGGAASSQVWCQIFADVLNCKILRLKANETETLGDIIAAAQSVGIKEVPYDFGKTIAEQGELLLPNLQNTILYDMQFAKYKKLYASIKDMF